MNMNSTMDHVLFLNMTTPSNQATATEDYPEATKSASGITYTERVVVMTMLVVLSVVGVIGNSLAIYVFARLKQKLTSTIFILTLAGTDFITCLISIPYTIIMEYLDHELQFDFLCKVYHFLVTTTVPFSCVVIVAIAVDRYMCICHPFHHWMTIKKARVIIGILAVCIFIFGGIVCMHHSIYKKSQVTLNVTATPDTTNPALNASTAEVTLGGTGLSFPPDHSYTAYPFSPGPSYTHDLSMTMVNRTDVIITSPRNDTTAAEPKVTTRKQDAYIKSACDVNEDFIDDDFFFVFRKLYTGIFLVSCIIVLVLYSLIYRSVIAQRRKKLRIKSAQCCLLWNATSVEAPHEAAEMTQSIELSHMNGEDRYTTRLNSGAGEDAETHNNGAVRKCSLSKARIERMRVANIKTAFTLFVVTLVFILAFLPAWLMALKVISMNVIVFYMHYVYNVVNPFIYAFLNQNFKTELRRIFRCGKQ